MSTNADGYPRAWIVYGVATISVVLVALDVTGIAANFASLLVIPCLFLTTLVTIVRTPSFVRRHGGRGLLPVIVLILALPVAMAISVIYSRLEFPLRRTHYERVALAIRSGSYHLPLKPEDASLGVARVVRDGPDVVAVSFITVSHGFAGHGGYLRAFGDETALKQGKPPGGWTFSRPLGAGWYAVGEH